MTRKYSDEEIQKLVFESSDENDAIKLEEDGAYYKMIRQALETEPEVMLPGNFAEGVAALAVRRKKISVLYRSSVVYISAFLILAGVSSSAFYFLAKDVFFTIVSEILNYKYPLVFGVFIFFFIQLFDEMLVGRRMKFRE